MGKRKPRKPRTLHFGRDRIVKVYEDGVVDLGWSSEPTSASQARRIAAWLLKYAEWREEKDRG